MITWQRLKLWIKQILCGLTGHNYLLAFEPERITLKCSHCEHDSGGWPIKG